MLESTSILLKRYEIKKNNSNKYNVVSSPRDAKPARYHLAPKLSPQH